MTISRTAREIIILLVLSIGAYLPALRLPFIADDYGQIPLARHDAAAGWEPLLHDVSLRTRATYMFLSAALDRVFGFTPMPFYAASILLHSCCVLLLYALRGWPTIGKSTAFWAACFFAVHEGHQEAVMWLAAAYDLIVFIFGMLALLSWRKWLESGRWTWYAVSLASILVAAISKETFWVFVLLMLAITIYERKHRRIGAVLGLTPFIAVSIAYVLFMFMTRLAGGGAMDDRFVVSGGRWILVAVNSIWRLLFPQGLGALAVLLWIRRRTDRFTIAFACLWILLGILPHSFLQYMPRIASRHTYLASAGLALLVGVALTRLSRRIPPIAFAVVCAVILIVNVEILWVKKFAQFRERAEPTELVKAAARRAAGPLTIECTPVPDLVIEDALESVGSKAIFPKPENHQEHCFVIEYRTRDGSIVRMDRRLEHKHGAFY
jgi:hypothetical protein